MTKAYIYKLCYIHSKDNGRIGTRATFTCLVDARNALKSALDHVVDHRSTKPDKVLKGKNGFVAIFLPNTTDVYTITYFIVREG